MTADQPQGDLKPDPMTWTCRRCGRSGEAAEHVVMVWHRCQPPPAPRRRIGLHELFADLDHDLFDDRTELYRRMLENLG